MALTHHPHLSAVPSELSDDSVGFPRTISDILDWQDRVAQVEAAEKAMKKMKAELDAAKEEAAAARELATNLLVKLEEKDEPFSSQTPMHDADTKDDIKEEGEVDSMVPSQAL